MKSFFRSAILVIESLAIGFGGAIGWIIKGDPYLPFGWMKPVADLFFPLIKSNAWWLTLGSTLVIGASKVIRRIVLPDPWFEQALASILNNGRLCLIDPAVMQNSNIHHHRVTLYRYAEWSFRPKPLGGWIWFWGWGRGPASGWLIPVARSGHTTQKVKSTFLAPDDADACEGVVGRAWACEGVIHNANLPLIDNNSSDADIRNYAKNTWVSESWVRSKMSQAKPLARSFVGYPIKVRGRRWGVVVVDSVDPNGVINPNSVSQQLVQLELFIDTIVGKGRS